MKRTILLNPGPVTTTDSVKRALLVEDICHREATFTAILDDIRNQLLHLAGADASYCSVLFASSGTGAIEACISTLIPHNKAIAVINNGAYGQRIIDIAMRYQIRVIELSCVPERPLPLVEIERRIAENAEIAYVAMVHHETSFGILNPLHEIGKICQRQQRGFIVDAMSSFAGTDIDVIRDHIDFLVSSSNKCIQGMPGLAFVIGKTKLLLACQQFSRSYYFDLYQQFQSFENTGQMPFTVPVQIAYALQQALKELINETISRRIQRYHSNYDCLVRGLISLGLSVLTPTDRASKLLVTVAFPTQGLSYSFAELHRVLFKHGITIYPAKSTDRNLFRIACIGDLTSSDIEHFLNHLAQYLDAVILDNGR